MRRAAIMTLVKDLIIAAVAYFLITTFLSLDGISPFYGSTMNRIFIGMALAGIPFGGRWASRVFSAVSVGGVLIKLLFAVFLGWLAIFVVIIGDIIRCLTAGSSKNE